MRTRGVLVGIDLGTTAVKVVAHALDGREVATASERYRLRTPQPAWVEQDPDAIYRAAMESLRAVLGQVRARGEETLAIGFSAAMHGIFAVDAKGKPISPLINWMDRRAAEIAENWQADGTAARLYARTGAPMHPMLPLCKLRWLAENQSQLFTSAARFVGLKELFIYRWTGEWLIDEPIATATGMLDTRARAWDPEALALAGVEPARLSRVVPASTQRRLARPRVAAALGLDGTAAIVIGSSDGALANLGVGAIRRDVLALTLGTSGALRSVADAPALDPAGRTFCYVFDDAHWIVGGSTSSAGASLEWIFGLVAPEVAPKRRFERAIALADEIGPGADGLSVLPFLSGERAPYWRADLRGEFVGLDLAHDRRHVLRAAFEGVVYALQSVHRVMQELVGDSRIVLLSGGLTHAPFVCQLIADVFELEVRLPDRPEASAFGAALMAGLAIGALSSLEETAQFVGYPQVFRPVDSRRAAYQEAFARYTQAVESLLT